jgi:hypothetical protein
MKVLLDISVVVHTVLSPIKIGVRYFATLLFFVDGMARLGLISAVLNDVTITAYAVGAGY